MQQQAKAGLAFRASFITGTQQVERYGPHSPRVSRRHIARIGVNKSSLVPLIYIDGDNATHCRGIEDLRAAPARILIPQMLQIFGTERFADPAERSLLIAWLEVVSPGRV